jgi:molecular chaperone HscC
MIIGIDLGTTHSLVGLYDADGPRLIPNALGDLLTPSVVSIDEGGEVLVGQAARERLVTHPARTVANFKRWMGTSRTTRLGDREFRPEELSALVLRALVRDVEHATGSTVDEAVISVPAYFSDAQRKATRHAGELAGIRVERLINEPTAAALAYGLQGREDGGSVLVFDLGGGTFDVSVLEMFEGVMEVHASAGDNFLGGEDFLTAMHDAFVADTGIDPASLEPARRAQLMRRLEVAKRQVCAQGRAVVELDTGAGPVQWTVDEERFTRITEPLVQRLRTPLERAMRDARLRPGQLDEIIMVGGASRMPVCARLVTRMFGRLPLRHVDPDQAIALGACVAAGMKARHQLLEEVVLTDVCPHSLGVETSRELPGGGLDTGLFAPVIQRNSTVPVSRVERFYPAQDGQRMVQFNVYQGESPRVANNIRLGELTVDVPPRRAIENPVEVRFTYDVNGILLVEATAIATGERREVVLEKNPGVLTADEIRQRLAALETLRVHPRDDQQNIAVLARAERLYEEFLHARDVLQDAMVGFRAVLERQDPRESAQAREQLVAVLDGIEAETV